MLWWWSTPVSEQGRNPFWLTWFEFNKKWSLRKVALLSDWNVLFESRPGSRHTVLFEVTVFWFLSVSLHCGPHQYGFSPVFSPSTDRLVWSLSSLGVPVLLLLGTRVGFLSRMEALVLWVCSFWTVLVILRFFSSTTFHVIFYVIGRSAGCCSCFCEAMNQPLCV